MQPMPASDISRTPNVDFLFGTSGLSQNTIPYFQVSMKLQIAASELVLVNEMPGAADQHLKIEELFQRDIDWTRVDREIIPYLQNNAHPQFFNALTIALLPMRQRRIVGFDAPGSWAPPQFDNPSVFKAVKHYGPITCGYWADWSGWDHSNARLGQITWNKDQICGVAIDGQHRLAAIKQMQASGLLAGSVPVILIVLHPDLGFSASASATPIDTLRKLFIDLNKHARIVSRARQILLDDRDPVSLCVRSMTGTELTAGDSELSADPPRLPLTMVDWHSEQGKFNVGPYVATVLGLDWIVATLVEVGAKAFVDSMSHEELESALRKLITNIGLTGQLTPALERLGSCRQYDRPFSFLSEPVDELQTVATAFARRWSPPILHLLTEFGPYRALLKLRRDSGTLRPEFARWYSLKQKADEPRASAQAKQFLIHIESSLQGRPSDPISIHSFNDAVAECNSLKTKNELAFTVVFQRALFIAFQFQSRITNNVLLPAVDSLDLDGADVEPVADETSGRNSKRAEQFVEALNLFVKRQPLFLKQGYEFTWKSGRKDVTDRFWLCSLQTPEGAIDFSQVASKRAADLLVLIGILWLFLKIRRISYEEGLRILDEAWNATAGLEGRLAQCLNRMNGANNIAYRILSSRDDEDANDSDKRKQEIINRAHWVWRVLNNQ